MKKPLPTEYETPTKEFSVSKKSGLLAARIEVRGTDGKFFINGLITRITLHLDSLQLVYYDTTGHHHISIDLEHLAEMQEYRSRDGTKFLIEDEKLVSQSKNLNSPNEEDNRASANLTIPEIPRMDLSEVPFTSTYPR